MWVYLSDAFLSVVKHTGKRGKLLVRAREPGDLERVMPWAKVEHTPSRDYPYRTVVTRQKFAAVLAAEVKRIDYPNFKNSVEENPRHDAYLRCWSAMLAWQQRERRPVKRAVVPAAHFENRGGEVVEVGADDQWWYGGWPKD